MGPGNLRGTGLRESPKCCALMISRYSFLGVIEEVGPKGSQSIESQGSVFWGFSKYSGSRV